MDKQIDRLINTYTIKCLKRQIDNQLNRLTDGLIDRQFHIQVDTKNRQKNYGQKINFDYLQILDYSSPFKNEELIDRQKERKRKMDKNQISLKTPISQQNFCIAAYKTPI